MARYQLDDPRLQDEMDQIAADTAANWPAPDESEMAQLARLLSPPPAAPKPARRATKTARPDRRAA